MNILIINGPNLNLLGKREKSIYGEKSFEDYLCELQQRYAQHHIAYYQSNIEGELIGKIQEAGFSCDGIVLNAGAYTHVYCNRRCHTSSARPRYRGAHLQYTCPGRVSAHVNDSRRSEGVDHRIRTRLIPARHRSSN